MIPHAGRSVCGKVVLVSESPLHLGAPDSRPCLVIAGASVLGGDPRMERSLDSGQLSPPCKGLRARPVHDGLSPELGAVSRGRCLCITCQGLCLGDLAFCTA